MHQMKINFNGQNENVCYESLKNYKLKEFDGQSGTTVQPVIKNYLQFNFSGNNKIESHRDVAQLMAVLESKSAEHFFAVHVNSDKEPLIQYVASGARNQVMVDQLNIHAVANYHNTKDLYLIHNHPSGSLKPSRPDMELTQRILDSYLPLNINVEHLIINTYKKEYVLIDSSLDTDVFVRPEGVGNFEHQAVTLHDMDFLREPIGRVTSSNEAFELIQQFRFSALPKYGAMVLNSANEVVGNFLMDDLTLKTVAKAVVSVPNGVSVIAYGNRDTSVTKSLDQRLRKFGIPLLDYIKVNSNGQGVQGAHKSYSDTYILNDIQERYQTNPVKNDFNIEHTLKR